MNRPPRLAHVWSSDMGAVLSLPQMRHFVGKGWEVTVLCPEGPRLSHVRAAGVRWTPLSLSRRLLDPKGDVTAAAQIARACRDCRFDLVHTHNIKAGLVGRVSAGLAGAPGIVHTMHGMPFATDTSQPGRFIHERLEWVACLFADRVLVQSREDRDTVLRSQVIAPEKVVRIGNGIDLSRFDPNRTSRLAVRAELGIVDEDVLFLSAGRLVREKGFLELSAAAALAREANARIRVAIAGPRDSEKADCLSDEDMATARARGVVFLGERDDMANLYAAADVVVLPSWREGLPRVLIEGAAMAKPLLAADVRGSREVVVAGHGGTLVPPRSPEALARAMIDLADNGERRAACGAFNRARAVAQYDVRRVVARVEAVYNRLLARRAS